MLGCGVHDTVTPTRVGPVRFGPIVRPTPAGEQLPLVDQLLVHAAGWGDLQFDTHVMPGRDALRLRTDFQRRSIPTRRPPPTRTRCRSMYRFRRPHGRRGASDSGPVVSRRTLSSGRSRRDRGRRLRHPSVPVISRDDLRAVVRAAAIVAVNPAGSMVGLGIASPTEMLFRIAVTDRANTVLFIRSTTAATGCGLGRIRRSTHGQISDSERSLSNAERRSGA
jgi:hypothetical protein